MKASHDKKGKQGELVVADHLTRQGFTIIAQNYRKFYGEIDIIGKKKDLFVFVEVKLRTQTNIDPAELIIPSKQHKIGLVAREFLATHPAALENATYRFDVALVAPENNSYNVRYIENAFTIVD